MIQVKTIHKIAFAKLLYHFITFFRKILGLSDFQITKRSDLKWDLDLKEGVDISIYVLGQYEPEVFREYKKLLMLGDYVVDIGANVGGHALVFSKLVGRTGKVFAIEPTNWAYNKLKRNVDLNPNIQLQTSIHQMALVELDGKELDKNPSSSYRLDTALSDYSRSKIDCGYEKELDGCQYISLDSFVEEQKIDKLKLIKIDVDGNEIKVLKGARKTLDRLSPILLLELSPIHFTDPDEPFEKMIDILRDCNYQLQYFCGKKLEMNKPEMIKKNINNGVLINVLGFKSPS